MLINLPLVSTIHPTIPESLTTLVGPMIAHPISLTPKKYQNAVEEMVRNDQIDIGLAASAALAGLSVSFQGLYDVKTPVSEALRPISLAFIVIAESGARKSTCFRRIFDYIKLFEDVQHTRYHAALSNIKEEKKAWKSEGKALEAERKQLQKKGESTEGVDLAIQLHGENEPLEPHPLQVWFEDASVPAVLQSMSRSCPSVMLSSDEAAILTKGPALDILPTLNKALDGDTLKINRKDRDTICISNPRMTLALSLQLQPFTDFIKRNKSEALENGFLNRVLLCQVSPQNGTRIISGGSVSWEHLPKFIAHLDAALKQTVDGAGNYCAKRSVMEMTPEAELQWITYYNWVEANSGAFGKYARCLGHASKLAENVARMAALFQILESEDQITLKNLNGAIAMVNWFSNQFINLVVPNQASMNSLSQVQQDANELNAKLLDRLRGLNIRFVSSAELLRFAPNHLRKERRAKDALIKLLEDRFVVEYFENRTSFIDLFPQVANNPFTWQQRVYKLKMMAIPHTQYKSPDPYLSQISFYQL